MNHWHSVKESDSNRLLTFLLKHELAGINLIDRFFDTSTRPSLDQEKVSKLRTLEKDSFDRIVVAELDSNIVALLAFSSNGFLFALEAQASNREDWADGLKLLDQHLGRLRKRMFALVANEAISKKIADHLLLTVVHRNTYLIMDLPLSKLLANRSNFPSWPPKQAIHSNFQGIELRSCDSEDLDCLIDLQLGYELEEVIIPGQTIVKDLTRNQLARNLQTQRTLAAFFKGQAIAKVSSNAQTWNWIQIGGVYTMPAWRGRGIAQELMKLILEDILNSGYSAGLFVKQSNESARHVYEKLHFHSVGDLSIRYY